MESKKKSHFPTTHASHPDMTAKRVFVTTGATIPFLGLIEACLAGATLEVLASLGFTEMVVQYGKAPTGIIAQCNATRHGVAISGFCLKHNLNDDIRACDLVISHAGTGSILDALRLKKPLIAVVNTSLMDNHQQQIASILSNDGHLIMTTPDLT